VVRKSVFQDAGGFDEDPELISVEDYDLWLRIAAKHSLDHVDEPLVRYRRHPQGISKNHARSYFGEKKVLELNHKRFARQYPTLNHRWPSRMAQLYFELGMEYFIDSRLQEAKPHFHQSLKHRPVQPKVLAYTCACWLGPRFVGMVRAMKRGQQQ
jgi:hypothetical protein